MSLVICKGNVPLQQLDLRKSWKQLSNRSKEVQDFVWGFGSFDAEFIGIFPYVSLCACRMIHGVFSYLSPYSHWLQCCHDLWWANCCRANCLLSSISAFLALASPSSDAVPVVIIMKEWAGDWIPCFLVQAWYSAARAEECVFQWVLTFTLLHVQTGSTVHYSLIMHSLCNANAFSLF